MGSSHRFQWTCLKRGRRDAVPWLRSCAFAQKLCPRRTFRVAKMTELHRRRRRRRTISISYHLWYKNCSAVVRVRKLALEALQS